LSFRKRELAETAGLYWTYISGIERGRRNPGLHTVDGLQPPFEFPSLNSFAASMIAVAPPDAPRQPAGSRSGHAGQSSRL